MTSVLDASALLAYLEDETGADVVAHWLTQGAFMSSANLAEVLSKLAERGEAPQKVRAELEQTGLAELLTIEPLTEPDAVEVAKLRPITKPFGLSLGDRCCLALGARLGLPVVTADRDWRKVPVDVEMVVIR